MKGNKKGFNKDISSKRKTRENAGSLLNGAGKLMTKDMERAEVLIAFFALAFPDKAGLQESWVSDAREKVRSKEYLALVEKENI